VPRAFALQAADGVRDIQGLGYREWRAIQLN